MERILIVDDEPEIVRGLADNLKFEGHDTVTAANGAEALAAVAGEAPDLVLLDIMMPVMSGWDVAKELRRRGIDVPIIMLTARGEEVDRVLGLELGADDYLCKPFSMRELMARVKVLLRRASLTGAEVPAPGEQPLAVGPLALDPLRFEASWNGVPVALTVTEFLLLQSLARRPGVVKTREQLMAKFHRLTAIAK